MNFLLGKRQESQIHFINKAMMEENLQEQNNPSNFKLIDSDLEEYFKIMTKLLIELQTKDQQVPQEIIQLIKKQASFTNSKIGQAWLSNINQELKSSKSQMQQQEQKSDQNENMEPHWRGFHGQTNQLIEFDQNQNQEIYEDMIKDTALYSRFQSANFMVVQNPERAMKMYQTIIQDYKDYAVIYYNYGELAFINEKYDICRDAILEFQKIHQKKQFGKSKIFCFAYYYLGFSYMKLQEYQKAEENLLTAYHQNQKSSTFIQGVSDFYYRIKKDEKAEEFALKLVDNYQQFSANYDDQVELSRGLHTLLKLSFNQQKFKNICKYADLLANLEECNFLYIYNQITHYFLEFLNADKQLELLKCLKQSESYDIICEELYLLYLIGLKDQRRKKQELEQFIDENKILEEYQIYLQSYKTVQAVKQQQQEIQQIDEDQEDRKVEEAILKMIKPEKEKVDFDKKYVYEEIKQKKRKVQDLEQIQIKQQKLKEKNSDHFADFQTTSSVYIITIDQTVQFENNKIKQKFKQAAYKGFCDSNLNVSGIKILKINNKTIYELKIINNGLRLFCSERIKQGKSTFVLHFDKLLNHKEADRYIKQIK